MGGAGFEPAIATITLYLRPASADKKRQRISRPRRDVLVKLLDIAACVVVSQRLRSVRVRSRGEVRWWTARFERATDGSDNPRPTARFDTGEGRQRETAGAV